MERNCGTVKDTFTVNTLIKISSGKAHTENVRYVNKRSKKRILVEFICLSPGKTNNFFPHFQRAENTHVPKSLAQFWASLIMDSLVIKVVFSYPTHHIPNKNSDRDKYFASLSHQIWDFLEDGRNRKLLKILH